MQLSEACQGQFRCSNSVNKTFPVVPQYERIRFFFESQENYLRSQHCWMCQVNDSSAGAFVRVASLLEPSYLGNN